MPQAFRTTPLHHLANMLAVLLVFFTLGVHEFRWAGAAFVLLALARVPPWIVVICGAGAGTFLL